MDDAAHGEDSSSRNGSAVSRCERGADGRVRICLTDGSSFFVSTGFADKNSIEPGLEISTELKTAIETNAQELQAFKKGLELLGRREHTAFELARKLKERGFDRATAARAIDDLQEAGYLDERRYAEAWVRSRLKRRPEGYPRLAAGLARRGVDRKTIASVLEMLFTEEESDKALAKAAEKILRRGDVDETTALRKLTAKGFSYRHAKAHLQKLQ
jgi:regulatory protein